MAKNLDNKTNHEEGQGIRTIIRPNIILNLMTDVSRKGCTC